MIQGQYGWGDLLKVADEAGFTLLPIGEYDVIVASADVKATQAGKDSIVVFFQVTTGPHQGKKIRNQFTISPDNPNAVGFFFRHMSAIGLPREYFAQSPPPSLPNVAQALLNRPCRIKVTHREWGGTMRDNVDAIMSATTAAPTVPGTPQVPGAPQAAPVPTVPATPAVPAAPAVPAPPVAGPYVPAAAPVAGNGQTYTAPAPAQAAWQPPVASAPPVNPVGVDVTTGDPVFNFPGTNTGVDLVTGQPEIQVSPGIDVPAATPPELPF